MTEISKTYPSGSPIKYWAEDDKPREKLVSKGKSALSNSELLAIVIGSGYKDENAVELSKKILESCGNNLVELSRLGLSRLRKFKGVGLVKAVTIEAALELGRRRQQAQAHEKQQVHASRTAYDWVKSRLEDLHHEEFWVIYLNRANRILSLENLSKGGISGTVADSRLIFQKALELKSTGIILVHNHPSGSLKPSQQDLDLTRRMKAAGQTLEISVLDHLIIAEDKYFSFADEGLL
ncbi:MAG TPA: DNA repair protein RadC [Saprospiraceae bacterium]|nr:DNA repair protein RadC [Saprospiraceae bacterium]